MNPLQTNPHLFANQEFWIRHGDKNGNYTDYPPFKWGIDGGVCIINDEEKGKDLTYPMTEQLTLIARPIESLSDEETYSLPIIERIFNGITEANSPSQIQYYLINKANNGALLFEDAKGLLDVGVYPGPQEYFGDTVIDTRTLTNEV